VGEKPIQRVAQPIPLHCPFYQRNSRFEHGVNDTKNAPPWSILCANKNDLFQLNDCPDINYKI